MIFEEQKNEFAMARLMLNDERWSRLRKIMREHRVYDKVNLRMMVEGMLYRMRVGCPWRDLPPEFGCWNSIYQKFNRWSSKNKLINIFKSLVQDPDCEWEFIDGSIVKSHQHSAGAARIDDQAIGKSKGGNTTKIHMVVNSMGLPIGFELTGGHRNDCTMAPTLIAQSPKAEFIIADKAYDGDIIRAHILDSGATPIIPRRIHRRLGNQNMDWSLYKCRHLVENFFARIKQYRAIATRYDKLKRNYASTLAMACAYLWLPM